MEADPLEAMVLAFAERVSILKRTTLLRVASSAKGLYTKEISAVDAELRALEGKLKDIQSFIQQEKESLPKVQSLIAATSQQNQHLSYIAAHLPQRLPSLQAQTALPTTKGQDASSGGGPALVPGTENQSALANAVEAQQKPPARKHAPKRYVSQSELNGVSSYLKGRVTLDKVNCAIDELAQFAEANAALVAAARNNRFKASTDRKRATALLHEVASKDGVKGKFWFLEGDTRQGQVVRPDKSGRALLTLLRHMGRLQEVRVVVQTAKEVAYVLT